MYAQQVKFAVKDTSGKPLHGATLSVNNLIGAVSDTAGIIRVNPIQKIVRLHCAGYTDMPLVLRDTMPDIIMQRSIEPLMPININYSSPLQLEKMVYERSSFDITPIDSLALGDTILEKVTQIEIESACTLATFMIFVTNVRAINKQDFTLALYENDNGRPGNVLTKGKIKSHWLEPAQIFNLFDYQLSLKPGKYFIGYSKTIGGLSYNQKLKRYIDAFDYSDKKRRKGMPTYTRINNREWKPLLMPASKSNKKMYYSYSYALELVKHN
jgi:hypothetical protein